MHSMLGLILHKMSVCKRQLKRTVDFLKVMTRPCTAVRGHRGKLVGEGDVNVTSMYLIKHADITYATS